MNFTNFSDSYIYICKYTYINIYKYINYIHKIYLCSRIYYKLNVALNYCAQYYNQKFIENRVKRKSPVDSAASYYLIIILTIIGKVIGHAVTRVRLRSA